jgi:site-specific recombinase XerC
MIALFAMTTNGVFLVFLSSIAKRRMASNRHGSYPYVASEKEYELGLGATTEKHGKLTISRIRKLVNGCEFKTMVDASAEKVRKQLDLMKKEKKFGNKTYNHYLQAIDAFGNWLVATKRCLSNPFGGIPRLNTAVDVRRKRRA